MKAVMRRDVVTSPPWSKRRMLRAGDVVNLVPADNLPAESRIRWWVAISDTEHEGYVDAGGPYGIGLEASDVEFVDEEGGRE